MRDGIGKTDLGDLNTKTDLKLEIRDDEKSNLAKSIYLEHLFCNTMS